ncbi:hypothetical protein MKW92_045269 [Papaver armeniacum]|nr:hypothetical protein MKW92_045269 [Papaver armeniacum]
MGREAGWLYIDGRMFGTLWKPCMKDMISLLNCLVTSGKNDDMCDTRTSYFKKEKYKDLLHTCTDNQAGVFRKP